MTIEKMEITRLVTELYNRIRELVEQEGGEFPFIVDSQEWTSPEYNHQN